MILMEIFMYVTVLFFLFYLCNETIYFINLQFQVHICRKNLIHSVCSTAVYLSDHKESACNAGDLGSVPWSGRSPGGGTGSPLQYSCLKSPMDRGAWQATVHGSQRVRHN